MSEAAKTIYALATPTGGAIAVIRISGDGTLPTLQRIFSGKISHGRLHFGRIHDGDTLLDEAMAVYFRAPHSYTGEDMAELHIHGGHAVAKSVMLLLQRCGLYAAEAGEFSRRAFINGKMMLSDAEAVMDMINAAAQRSCASAVLQLSGVLSERISAIEDKIKDILSEIDAMIDYPDEMEDADVKPQIEAVRSDVDELISHGMNARYIRDGINIAIVGKPNVGKSSLLNTLICKDRAIVTHIAGTTRDVIESQTQMDGLPVCLYDTAGLHETVDEVERIGIERTMAAVDTADICYVVLDISRGITYEDEEILAATDGKRRIIVLNKADIAKADFFRDGEIICTVSTKTGQGIEDLKNMTAQMVCPSDESGLITNMRHIEALQKAHKALCDALYAPETDCMAQDLHVALHALGQITGNEVDEDVIDRIFERFCVGK